MGSVCSSSRTTSDKDVRPLPNRPKKQGRKAKLAAMEVAAAGGDEANANALGLNDAEEDELEEEEEEVGSNRLTAVQVLSWLKLSAVSLVSIAGAFYLTRKLALIDSSSNDLDLAEQLATDFNQRMSSVEAQQISSKYSPGCVSCGLKSLKTVTTDNDQKNASKGAIAGRNALHKAYAKGDDFAPPRIYHNYWAASDFPSQYYSKSDTIKNYRFRRIFGW